MWNGVFARLYREWDDFEQEVDTILDAGDRVVMIGRYHGVYKGTGRQIRAQAVHVWRMKNGKAVEFQQYADTLQVAKALAIA